MHFRTRVGGAMESKPKGDKLKDVKESTTPTEQWASERKKLQLILNLKLFVRLE